MISYICLFILILHCSYGKPIYPSVILNQENAVVDAPEVTAAKVEHLSKLALSGGGNPNTLILNPNRNPGYVPTFTRTNMQAAQLVYVKPINAQNRYALVQSPILTSRQNNPPSWVTNLSVPVWNQNQYGTNLPVTDTPEVQAAQQAHFAAISEALAKLATSQ